MSNTFVPVEKKNEELTLVIQRIFEILSKTQNALTTDLTALDKNTYQFVSEALYKTINNLPKEQQVLYRALFHLVYRSEVLSFGAGLYSLHFILAAISDMLRANKHLGANDYELSQEYQKTLESLKTLFFQHTKPPTMKDLESVVSKTCANNPVVQTAIMEAIKLSGIDGKIVIEDGKQSSFLLEQKPGYSFKLKPYSYLLPNGTWNRNQCKVLMVDGFVENISEIDHLLLKAHETRQPMVIFSTGFSEEVVATIKTNNDRAIFDINLVRIPVDVNSINMIVDIAVVCGAQPVSSLSGQSLTLVKWNELATIDKINVRLSETAIQHEKSKFHVLAHMKSLLEKRNQSSYLEDLENLIDLRLRTLASDTTTIHLPDVSFSENSTIRVQIDNGLRAIKAVMQNGIVDLDGVLKDYASQPGQLSSAIEKGLQGIASVNKEVPALSLLVSLTLSGPVAISLITSSGMVVSSEE
jgi:chaperonin GroEL